MRLTIRVPALSRAPVLPADEGVPLAVPQQGEAYGHGGILFYFKGGGGVVVHVDHLGGVDNGHALGQAAALVSCTPDLSLPPYQGNFQARTGLGGVQRAPDNLQRGVVPAHGVNNNPQ